MEEAWKMQPPQNSYPSPSFGNPQQPNNNQQPMPPQPPPQKPLFFSRKVGRMPLWLLVLLFVFFMCSCGSTQQASSSPTQAPTQVQPTNAPATPTTVPTKQTGLAVTHGTPHLGGPLSDFIGAFGQPNSHGTTGASYHFLTVSSVDGIIVGTTFGIANVDDVEVNATNGNAQTSAVGWIPQRLGCPLMSTHRRVAAGGYNAGVFVAHELPHRRYLAVEVAGIAIDCRRLVDNSYP